MAGMYTMCTYSKFSIKDVGKFERRLSKWCNEECMRGKSMLIFDRTSLLVGGEPTIETQDNKKVYKVALKEISFTYLQISDSMCIMYKVWENKTQSVIYNMPSKWDGTELWLGD